MANNHRLAVDLREVTEEIERIFTSRANLATTYGREFTGLWQVARECVLGGKLVRPRLLISAFDALVQDQIEPAPTTEQLRKPVCRIAAAVEVLHYSFLLHDDVIDGDFFRRGRPNLIGSLLRQVDPVGFDTGAFDPSVSGSKDRHWATTGAILMGDLLLSVAHQIFAREQLPEDTRLRLLDLLDHTITESVAGEHLDAGLTDGIIPAELPTVLEMSRLKTATYTFELPLRAAAILADSPALVESTLGSIGQHLGIAFQLQDDYLSAFGDQADHGKDAFSDLREGKETTIIAHARSTSVWPRIAPSFGDVHLTQRDGHAIRALLTECHGDAHTLALIDQHLCAAKDLASARGSELGNTFGQVLTELVDQLKDRRS